VGKAQVFKPYHCRLWADGKRMCFCLPVLVSITWLNPERETFTSLSLSKYLEFIEKYEYLSNLGSTSIWDKQRKVRWKRPIFSRFL
jgi:hypothetical protein